MALPRVPMAQFLVQKGYLNPEQLQEAQKVQQQTRKPFDEVLVNLGMVGEREVLQAKAQEMGMPFVDLDRTQIESSAINVVPERIVTRHNVIPVKKQDNQLWVAMAKPGDIQAIDDVTMASGCRVIPVIAVPGAIEDAIRKHYTSGTTTTNAGAAGAAVAAAAAANPAPAGTNDNYSAIAREAIAKAGVGRNAAEAGDADAGEAADESVANQAPIIKLANALIQQAIVDRASDIHVEPQPKSVRVRYPR